MYQSIPKPPIPHPRHTPGIRLEFSPRVALGVKTSQLTSGRALDFCVKMSVNGGKQKDFAILSFSMCARSRVIVLVDSTWVFLLLSFYIFISGNMPLVKVWSEDKLKKKFVVAENFAEGKRFCYLFIS